MSGEREGGGCDNCARLQGELNDVRRLYLELLCGSAAALGLYDARQAEMPDPKRVLAEVVALTEAARKILKATGRKDPTKKEPPS